MSDKSKEVVIVGALRTPIGKYKGSLKNISADMLGEALNIARKATNQENRGLQRFD